MERVIEILQNLGLKKKECNVFLCSLKLGQQPASVIARMLKLNRVTAYVILNRLVQKGLIRSYTKKGVQFFSALSPQELIDYADRKSEEWKNTSNKISHLLPELLHIAPMSANLPKMRFYEGTEGIKEVYTDTLKNTSEILGFLTVEHISQELKRYFVDYYTPKRKKKGIPCRLILVDCEKSRRYHKLDKQNLRKTYLLPKNCLPFEVEISIYGKDRVALISFTETDLSAVIIQSLAIHNTLKSLYLFCETMAKKIDFR